MDDAIEEISPEEIIVMREQDNRVTTETIPIAEIVNIKKASVKKMSMTSKALIGTAVAVGVLFVGALAACASATYPDSPGTPEPAH